jgi:D-alanyl-D-alanine carboxypeptidase (penicillin-binding protein 5/6)
MSWAARIYVACGVAVILIGLWVWGTWPAKEVPNAVLAAPICNQMMPRLAIGAKAAYVEDLKTGKTIFAQNETAQLPLASITKLMTLLVADNVLKPDDTVTITSEALTPDGGGLSAGEVWRAQDLMDYTLIQSVNDGAHALALAAAAKKRELPDGFIIDMNAEARTLGLTQTYFANDTGLDISTTVNGASGSAHDIARLLAYIVENHPRLLEASTNETQTFRALSGETHTAENTSSLTWNLPGAIASKTGFTDLAGGNLALMFEPVPGRPVVAVVLGSTREGRDEDMKTLANTAKKYLTRVILCESTQ